MKRYYRNYHQYRRPIVIRLTNRRLSLLIAAMVLAVYVCTVPVLTAPPKAAEALAPALFGQQVVIDAGHGQWDPGMVAGDCREKDINLAVSLKLAELLREAGAAVTLIREDDTALADSKRQDMDARLALAQEAEAAIFISLHCNSFTADPAQHGAQVFFQRGSSGGKALAKAIQNRLAEGLQNTDRSALPHGDSYLLKHLEMPAVICEMGFLSNSKECALLQNEDYQWQLAWAIFRGTADYLASAAGDAAS